MNCAASSEQSRATTANLNSGLYSVNRLGRDPGLVNKIKASMAATEEENAHVGQDQSRIEYGYGFMTRLMICAGASFSDSKAAGKGGKD